MALLNFKKRFVPLIEAGTKQHTIRALRKHPIKVGETLHLYTGLRQKGARLLGRFPCVRVQTVNVCSGRLPDGPAVRVFIDSVCLSPDETEAFLKRDGFPGGSKEAFEFWQERLPFSGQLIHWKRTESNHGS